MKSFRDVARSGGDAHRYPLRYGRVDFTLRKRFDVSIAEALLLDVTGTLSRRTGWCYASRAYLGDMLGLSVRQVRRLLSSLEGRGLLERHPKNLRWVRPVELWTTSGQVR